MEQSNQLRDKYNGFKITVPAGYKDVFSHFYFAENFSKKKIFNTLLPTYQTMLVFSFGAGASLYSSQKTEIRVERCIVLGTIRKAFEYALSPQARILVANFKDDAFYRFFGSVSFTENRPVNPDELLDDNCFLKLWQQLDKIKDAELQVNHILGFCKPYLREQNTIAKQLASSAEPSLNPIKVVARNNRQTERNVQMNQKKHFGYSAKEIGRFQRFIKAVELIDGITTKVSKNDWFTIIEECGYYDQSQLINDFKYYLHLSPKKYLKFQQDICNPHE